MVALLGPPPIMARMALAPPLNEATTAAMNWMTMRNFSRGRVM